MIAELVGLAGSGKSTIATTISQQNSTIETGYLLRWRYVLPSYYLKAVLTIPAYLSHYRGRGGMLLKTLKWMTYIESLRHSLSRIPPDKTILLDQGPVHWFTFLNGFAPGCIQDEWLMRWWQPSLRTWTSTLDMIFYLHCDDSVLIDRIRSRNKMHRIKNMSDQDAREFIGRYRRAYQDVISRLTVRNGPRVYHLFTDQERPEQIVARIISELSGKCS
jgi:shikimate kinase